MPLPLPLPPAEPMRLVRRAEIARGGMGSIELSRVEGGRLDGRYVAVKRLHPSVADDREFVSMFLDEAWITNALKHPNVASALAWGNDEDGMFLVVELVAGVPLSYLLKQAVAKAEPIAERTAAYLASNICAGLAAAHDLMGPDGTPMGLVHRDLTPGNVLVGFDGSVKIVDFGIAKAEERITRTRTGALKGKPAYMAPEQTRGEKVDARTDLFSFGVLLFELLAGERPWTAKGAFDLMLAAATAPAPDLARCRPGVTPMFAEIVGRCLAKKPDERYSHASEIQTRLDIWRATKGFEDDDAASLAAVVQRHAADKLAWFEAALTDSVAPARTPEDSAAQAVNTPSEAAERALANEGVRAPTGKHGTTPMAIFTSERASPEPLARTPAMGLSGTLIMDEGSFAPVTSATKPPTEMVAVAKGGAATTTGSQPTSSSSIGAGHQPEGLATMTEPPTLRRPDRSGRSAMTFLYVGAGALLLVALGAGAAWLVRAFLSPRPASPTSSATANPGGPFAR
jgi:hypothetical protein